jgi:hypothetical protein
MTDNARYPALKFGTVYNVAQTQFRGSRLTGGTQQKPELLSTQQTPPLLASEKTCPFQPRTSSYRGKSKAPDRSEAQRGRGVHPPSFLCSTKWQISENVPKLKNAIGTIFNVEIYEIVFAGRRHAKLLD